MKKLILGIAVMIGAGCTVTFLKKDPTLGIVETLAKAQATPTPQVVACKVTYPDGTAKDAVCPPGVKK